MKSRPGMTLLEILICIAGIAILAAIVFPLTNGFIKRAHKMRCQGNLRDIGFALDGYCRDHNGALPDLVAMRRSDKANVSVLEVVLLPYNSSTETFHCPADKEFFKKSGSSYAWNNLVSGMPREAMNLFGQNKAKRIPLVGDKEAFHGKKDGTNLLYGDFRTADKVRFTTGGGALGYAKD